MSGVNLKDLRKQTTQKLNDANKYIARTMVQKPILCCLGNWAVIVLMGIIVFAGNFFFLHELKFNDFLLREETDVKNFFAFDEAEERALEEASEAIGGVPFRTVPSFFFGPQMLFAANDQSQIFTPENLQVICDLEKLFVEMEDYPLFCHTEEADGEDTLCLPQQFSLANVFYQNNLASCELLPQALIDGALAALKSNSQAAAFFIDTLDEDGPFLVRSSLVLGTPLGDDSPPFKNFSTPNTDPTSEEAQEGHTLLLTEYSEKVFEYFGVKDETFNRAFGNSFFQRENTTLQVRLYGILLDLAHTSDVLEIDQLIIGGSFLFVLLYVWWYVQSFFLAFTALFTVSMSMVVGIFFYAVILTINYFTTIHVVSFFIILAIGANNFYVLVDAWKQSEETVREQIELGSEKLSKAEQEHIDLTDVQNEEFTIKRLEYAYGRAAMSVFNTSTTTFIAFAANLLSSIAPIAGFGLFSGLVVVVNFLLILTLHPIHLMIYHKYIFLFFHRRRQANLGDVDPEVLKTIQGNKKPRYVEQARSYYIWLMTETKFPIVSLLCTITVAAVMISFAAKLQTPTSLETLYSSNHMFGKFQEDFNQRFELGSDESFTEVFGIFGLERLNDNGVRVLDADQFRGTAVFNDAFDFNLEITQDEMKNYCDVIRTRECTADPCFTGVLLLREESMLCSIEVFQDFSRNVLGQEPFTTFRNGTSTGLTEQDILLAIRAFLSVKENSIHNANFGVIDGKVRYCATSFRQSMKVDQALQVKEPVLALYNEISKELKAITNSSFIQVSFDLVWQHTERGLVTGLFSGMALSLGLSFFIIYFGTRNVLISLFAISGVAVIVGTVLGSVQTLGFELGTTEAVAGVMVIGLAVDYIVHLGYMFIRGATELASTGELDEGKTNIPSIEVTNGMLIEFAVEKMMFTIVAGGLTTLSAGVVLFFCTLSFFLKMGILIMFTAFYSLMYAFFYFIPLLRLFGPGNKSNTPRPLSKEEIAEGEEAITIGAKGFDIERTTEA